MSTDRLVAVALLVLCLSAAVPVLVVSYSLVTGNLERTVTVTTDVVR